MGNDLGQPVRIDDLVTWSSQAIIEVSEQNNNQNRIWDVHHTF